MIVNGREVFAPGAKVQHFKREIEHEGNMYLYEIVGLAHHSETDETLMVYKALYGEGKMCARPLEMFMSEVDHEKYPDIKQKYRFEAVKVN
ncbi:Protein of unknown function [Oscillospiraceae bacterium]|nr:Protein of unknown function [Oscillospiraceae bacterium]